MKETIALEADCQDKVFEGLFVREGFGDGVGGGGRLTRGDVSCRLGIGRFGAA